MDSSVDIKKPKIAIGMILYEENLEIVKRSIESCIQSDWIFVIDGTFKDHPDNPKFSSKEIIEYLESLPNVIYVPAAGFIEPKKREIYFHYASAFDCDFLILLDSDNWIEGDWDEFKENLNKIKDKTQMYSILLDRYGSKWGISILFPDPKNWKYTECHNFLTYNGDIRQLSAKQPVIDGLILRAGDDEFRSDDYKKKSEIYQGKMIEYEKPFRDKYLH